MNADEIYQMIRREKIIAIVRGVGTDKILGVAEAFLAAGIKMLEITCNTKGAAQMITLLSKEMAGRMTIGAGTVITRQLCEEVLEAGAEFIIAPDVNPDVIGYCIRRDVAVLPGAGTATEILTAKRYGANMVKIFPAAAIGVEYIRMLRGPIDDIDFVAVGGVRPENIPDFTKAGCVAFGIGGSILRKDIVENRDWPAITAAARKYVEKIAAL